MTKRTLITVFSLFICTLVFSQMQFDTLSRIEKFHAKSGQGIETNFHYLGKISHIELFTTKIYLLNAKDSISGLRLSMKTFDNLLVEYYENVILDVTEVDELIDFIEKVASRIATKQFNNGVEYRFLSKTRFLCYIMGINKKDGMDWKVRLNLDINKYNAMTECGTADLLSFLKLLKQARTQLF